MRILLIGRFYGEGLAQLVADELQRMGHSIVTYDPGPKLRPFGSRVSFYLNRIKSISNEATSKIVRAFGHSKQIGGLRKTILGAGAVDITLVFHDFLTPAESFEVKRLTKAPLVLWFPDAISNFNKHMFLNGSYDALFFKDPYIVDILSRNINAPTFYMPECFCPHALPKGSINEEIEERFRCDIATAGNMYAYRIAFFANLSNYNIRLWGLPPPLWMQLGPAAPMVQSRFVAGAEKARAFRGASIVVNNLHPAEIWGSNVRTFEVCGAGAFQIVDWRPGLAQLFRSDQEIITFRNLGELKSKIEHYLPRVEERQKIALAGQDRALREHTYRQRLQLILETVAGRANGYPMPSINITSA